jgi:hypothetical protein
MRSATGLAAASRRSRRSYGPTADQQQPRLRHPADHLRPGLDQAVLALAGHQPGDAHADRRRPQPVALAHLPPVDRRVVGVGVDPGREQLDRAAAAHRPADPGRRPVADGGEQAQVAATRSSSRVTSGTRPTATSTPWVKPTQGTPVARVRRPASSPSGNAAPKQITVRPHLRGQGDRPAQDVGRGSMSAPGWRTTRNGWAASNAAAPGQAGAYTTTRSGGSRRTRLWQYCWIPPDRGGKSLVTSSRFTARAF